MCIMARGKVVFSQVIYAIWLSGRYVKSCMNNTCLCIVSVFEFLHKEQFHKDFKNYNFCVRKWYDL